MGSSPPAEDSDESLIRRVQGGDHQAFSTLVVRHSGMFFGAAYRMLGDKGDAEDTVQEAFMKLWSQPYAFDAARGAKFTTWFYRVVTNMSIDRARKRRPSAPTEVLETKADQGNLQDAALHDKRVQAALEAAIQALPEKQKAALTLCFYEGLSNKEAAAILEVNIKALESLLMRAKAGVRQALAQEGLLEGKGYAYG